MVRTRELGRFVVYATPLAALALVGTLLLRHFGEKDRLIAEQKRVISELELKLDRAFANELVADLRVDAVTAAANGERELRLTFIQYRPGTETPSFTKSFTLPGEEVYVDALVVQFERAFVERGDGLRGKSLLLFRRAFGDRQRPVDGVALFETAAGTAIPEFARVDAEPSAFERDLWTRFWTLANDPKAAAAAGVRVAQGEAPHVKAVAGQVYQLRLRAAGGLELHPRLPAAVVDAPAAGAKDGAAPSAPDAPAPGPGKRGTALPEGGRPRR
jgi:hypothetical protein